MKKFEYSGETYYYSNGKFYDSHFMELSKSERIRPCEYFLSTIDLRTLKFEEFIELTNHLDNGENYEQCMKIIEKGFEIYCDKRDYAKLMLPKLFRLYRLQKRSEKVLDLWENFWSKKINFIESSALYIVLGAAYCDENQIEKAEHFANKAYKLQCGTQNEYLSNLYMRINSMKN